MHGQFDPLHERLDHAFGGEPLGQRLDQVDRIPGDDRDQTVGEQPVVHGVGDVVAGRGGPRVQVQNGVDHEVLAITTFEVEDAVVAPGSQPTERDAVGHHSSPSGSSSSIRTGEA